jgi:hypothetical protein
VKHIVRPLVISTRNAIRKQDLMHVSFMLIFTVSLRLYPGREMLLIYIGLHPEEAVCYLEGILLNHSSSSRPVYAITGTGHHSKNGKDKVGKAIRAFLTEWRYAFREFSVPGDRNNVGGILGIDPSSYDKSIAAERAKEKESEGGSANELNGTKDTKVRIINRDEVLDAPKGPRRAGL